MVPQTFAPWQLFVVFAFKGGFIMDNLPIQAIVFIYQDGSIENVPITHFIHHLESLQNHIEKMPKFANLYYKYKFKFDEYVNYLPL